MNFILFFVVFPVISVKGRGKVIDRLMPQSKENPTQESKTILTRKLKFYPLNLGMGVLGASGIIIHYIYKYSQYKIEKDMPGVIVAIEEDSISVTYEILGREITSKFKPTSLEKYSNIHALS